MYIYSLFDCKRDLLYQAPYELYRLRGCVERPLVSDEMLDGLSINYQICENSYREKVRRWEGWEIFPGVQFLEGSFFNELESHSGVIIQ